MSADISAVSGSVIINERFTGELRWLRAGRALTLQQQVEVTSFGHHPIKTEQTYEWRNVPTEPAAARQQSPENKEPGT